MKKNGIVFLGIFLLVLVFGGLSVFLSALTGDLWGNLPRAIFLMSIFFVIPGILYCLCSIFIKNGSPGLTVIVSYLGGFIISNFINKIDGISDGNSLIYGFFISISCSIFINKMICIMKELNELREYKKTVDPYFDFFKERANEVGMSQYDYLQYCKRAMEERKNRDFESEDKS